MLIRSMINDQIHYQSDSSFMTKHQQLLKIIHGSKFIHDSAIVADVIAVIVVWGLINGR